MRTAAWRWPTLIGLCCFLTSCITVYQEPDPLSHGRGAHAEPPPLGWDVAPDGRHSRTFWGPDLFAGSD